MIAGEIAKIVSGIEETLARVSKSLAPAGGEGLDLLTYEDSIRRAIFLSPDVLDRLFNVLLDLTEALQHVYLDALYRSKYRFNASLDLSEIYAYCNPSPSQTWSSIVRFAIEHQDKSRTAYNVLPTTILEVLAYLRRFQQSCHDYDDYSHLTRFLNEPAISETASLESESELAIGAAGILATKLPFKVFIELATKSTEGRAAPSDPVDALFRLVTQETVVSIDPALKAVFADSGERVAHYRQVYRDVLGKLEQRRRGRLFNNSIDARSYQLSLALNEFQRENDKSVYMPILSRGIPLDEFASICWKEDPLMSDASVVGDSSFGGEVRESGRLFSTARGPHYHYLSTILHLRYPEDSAAVAKAAKECLDGVKSAIDGWAETFRRLDYAGTSGSVWSNIKYALLRVDRGEVTRNAKALSAIARSSHSRISNTDEFRAKLDEDRRRIVEHFPDRSAYHRVIEKNFSAVRDQVVRTFECLGGTIHLIAQAEENDQSPVAPGVRDLVNWAAQLVGIRPGSD
jgi:hypothetical protein